MDIQRFLVEHDGVVTRAQARHCGVTDSHLARLIRSGTWTRRGPATYFAVAFPWSAAAAVRVAGEWAGTKGGALGGVCAAWWWGFELDGPRPVTVLVPHGRSNCVPSGVRVRRHDPGHDRVRHRGLWVARRPLAVLDAAVALGRAGQPFLDRALQVNRVTLAELRSVQACHLGRDGSRTAGLLVARAGDRAASEPERRTIALLRDAGITGWSVNAPVPLHCGRQVVLDLAFLALRFAIEVDGWAYHHDPERFVRDRGRKRALVADGWTVVEVTWWELENTPGAVVTDIRRTLDRLGQSATTSRAHVDRR